MVEAVPDVKIARVADEIVAWLGAQRDAARAERFVLGLSGGIDSAVVCALCARAAGPRGVLGVIMPTHSQLADAEHAALVAETFGVPTVQIDLSTVNDALLSVVPEAEIGQVDDDDGRREQARRLAVANIRPRLRMTTLYYLANLHSGIVVGTGNRSEAEVGYFTKYGDGGVDLLPIVDLYKFEIRALARHLGVPESVIAKPPSAGLWQGQTDESELGLTYDQLDETLIAIERRETNGIDSAVLARVTALRAASAHKRQPVPAFRRSSHNRSGDTDSPVR